jgi:uroporphyrinogen III methyltransferase/synthase
MGEDHLVALLRSVGALPLHLPLIRVLPPLDRSPFIRAVREVRGYDWIVLTSPRAVSHLGSALRDEGIDPRSLPDAGVRVCAVGPATAVALEEERVSVDLLPVRFNAEGVVEAMRSANPENQGIRILLPRAQEGREVIPQELSRAGMRVDVVPAYRTVPVLEEGVHLADLVRSRKVDVLTFTSGSAVRSFAAAWSASGPPEVGIVAMGPSAASALTTAGLPVHRIALVHTLAGLVAALEEWEQSR